MRWLFLLASSPQLAFCQNTTTISGSAILIKLADALKNAEQAIWRNDGFVTAVYDETFLASGRGDTPNLEMAAVPGKIVEYKYAPVNVDLIADDLEKMLSRLSANLAEPYIGDRPEGLPKFSLLYIDEMRLHLKVKYDEKNRKFTWEFEPIKIEASGPQLSKDAITQRFKTALGAKYFPKAKNQLTTYVTKYATKILQQKIYKANDKKLLQKYGMDFFLKLRFDIVFPWVQDLDPHANNKHFFPELYRVILAQHMVVLPTGELYRIEERTSSSSASSHGFLRQNYRGKKGGALFGGTYTAWTDWEFFMEHGPGPIRLKGETRKRMEAGGLLGIATFNQLKAWQTVGADVRRGLAIKLRPQLILASKLAERRDRLFDATRENRIEGVLPSYTSTSPSFETCEMATLTDWTQDNNKGAMNHCIYLPIRIQHLLMEERMKILMGYLPVDSEAVYRVLHSANGVVIHVGVHRRCTDKGWSRPTMFLDETEAREVFSRCEDARYEMAVDYGSAFTSIKQHV